jgi:integrase/recombinase XerD
MKSRKRTDIYWKQDELHSRQLKIFNAWNGSEINKKLIMEFQNYLFAKGTKEVRISKILYGIRYICNWLSPMNLNELDKKNLEKLIAYIHQSKYSEPSKSDFKRYLKQFYSWYEDEDPRLLTGSKNSLDAINMYKYLKKHVKTSCKETEHDPASIITDQEINKIIKQGCYNDMDRACIMLLHETGCRIGEFLGIRIKDIIKKDTHWLVYVTGKTGERSIPFRDSIPYILKWLDLHPTNKPDDYLWLSIQGKYKGKPLTHIGTKRILDRCFKRAGVKKKNNAHWFRHSRSTIDASKYNEQILCKLRGWTIGSSMARRYTHLSGKDVEDAYRKAKGLEKPEEIKVSNEPIKCVCGRLNESESRYCSACGKALNMDVVMKEQEYLEKAFDLLSIIANNPDLKSKFEAFKEKSKNHNY